MDEYLFQHFTQYVEQVHAGAEYQTDFRLLAANLGIRVRPSQHNSLVWGEPPLITLSSSEYGARQGFSAMHEVAHLLLKECGAEAELLHHFGGFEEAAPHIEAWCNHAAGLLLLPAPLLQAAERQYGLSAQTVLNLYEAGAGRVSLGAALRRLVYADSQRRLAAFVSTASRRVSDLAKLNIALPFWFADPLPCGIPAAAEQQKTFALGGSEGSVMRVPKRSLSLGLLVAER
ncbi:ImmA/IrrE family metallo-endopeptidase [Deinococcus psychrotolerans]|uniref:ImmA/IrrE family metallo-endopeptidase n=1 Tax=Deinococcus psychrotolerans TaxID=2489213 RepID=A0A3G8YD35_9DEIO|nr:ImmA/IrrE family metallo-endopeptidase [Deinococcus psychrotolerans]AZI42147.1 ImmA/IrrE family metallo-endopeptidase [Deinococcus psychrotolerans]